jgi:hypothetical protein
MPMPTSIILRRIPTKFQYINIENTRKETCQSLEKTHLLSDLLTEIIIRLDKDGLLLDGLLRRLLRNAGAAQLGRRGRLAGHVAGDTGVRRVLPRVVMRLPCRIGEDVS